MSGGVDSSTTAAILKERGFDVYGITMKLFDNRVFLRQDLGFEDYISSGIESAKRIARQIGISHYTIDLVEEFRREVIDYFIDEYTIGKTPNPCVICNKKMKFNALFRFLDENEIDYLATGHYCRNVFDEQSGYYKLFRGKDRGKDQSYFLFTLSQRQLERILFPLGEYIKAEVKEKARNYGLKIDARNESNEVCFIPTDYRQFLMKMKPDFKFCLGNFVDVNGNVLGRHKGIHFYTVGQRRGLGISSDRPYYVKSINPQDNTITLCRKEELGSDELNVS